VATDLAELVAAEVELGVVVAYGAIVPASVLEAVPMLNLHFSLLPRWRGAAPIERAILAGDERTGVCVMGLERTLDTGPIYGCAEVEVGDKDLDALRDELVVLGSELLCDLLDGGLEGLPTPVTQQGEVTYASKLTDAELELDFTRPASELARVVRLGRARTSAEGRRLHVRRAEVVPLAEGAPGTLHGDVVTTGEGGLRLCTIVPEGRRAMDVASWRRGLRDVVPTHLGQGTAS
jgi:methionyl-tRNA formyltransferase